MNDGSKEYVDSLLRERSPDGQLPRKRAKLEVSQNPEVISTREHHRAFHLTGLVEPEQGVRRITPCPPECRPQHRDYVIYRELLVKRVIDELNSEGKRVTGHVRFL